MTWLREREEHPAARACAQIAHDYGFEFDELFDRVRDHRHAMARRACYVRLREAPFRWSYPKIGSAFGFDHTTVQHHVKDFAYRKRVAREMGASA